MLSESTGRSCVCANSVEKTYSVGPEPYNWSISVLSHLCGSWSWKRIIFRVNMTFEGPLCVSLTWQFVTSIPEKILYKFFTTEGNIISLPRQRRQSPSINILKESSAIKRGYSQ